MSAIAWRAGTLRRAGVSAAALAALALSFAADLATGPALLPIADVLAVLAGWWRPRSTPPQEPAQHERTAGEPPAP